MSLATDLLRASRQAVRPLTIPLSRWADRQLRALARETGSAPIAALDGTTITGERGAANAFTINGTVSAGPGSSRLYPTRDGGWFAMSLLRAEDRELLPALFGKAGLDANSTEAIARAAAASDCGALVEQGRALGLPVASADETPASPQVEVMTRGTERAREQGHRPLVIDLSAIWAGPLAGHLLWLAGADVVKVESRARPDLIRRDDSATFGRINQGKANVAVDLENDAERAELVALIRRADIVIESSRPRALRHFGIDADALVRDVPGLVWLSVTGHGAIGEPAGWAGMGHDCGVAAGLSRAMERAGGGMGYVGDAVADPLTGITAAREGLAAFRKGHARRIGFSLSAIAARALAEEQAHDPDRIAAELRAWGAAVGQPFPAVPLRALTAPVREIGADTAKYLPGIARC